MRRFIGLLVAGAVITPVANAAVVTVGDSTAPWLGYMNVFELPANGGGYVFGSSWGIADLNASFNDGAGTLTLSPNTIGDPNEFWYQDTTGSGNTSPGGPGAPGNKIMEASLYQEAAAGVLNGQTVTFSGMVLSNTFTDAHETVIFIRDFAADYSSFVETAVIADAGAFSISLDTIADAGRHVQYGFRTTGVNVWVTDTAPFGNVVISTIPTPASGALIALGGLVATRRRR